LQYSQFKKLCQAKDIKATLVEVPVYELFKMDLVPDESKELINRLSEDITQKVNQALKGVFNYYLR